MADPIKILWADDEIELLKPQLFFLEKGYDVITVSNGYDALETMTTDKGIDVVFWMKPCPDYQALETLPESKPYSPAYTGVMITKMRLKTWWKKPLAARSMITLSNR